MELGCHPGYVNDLDTIYQNERLEEVEVLCDPRVRGTIVAIGIELRSFTDVFAGPYCKCLGGESLDEAGRHGVVIGTEKITEEDQPQWPTM